MSLSPEMVSSLKEELKAYNSLELTSSNGISVIKGNIELIENGVFIEAFDIELLFPLKYHDFSSKVFPYRYPLVFETGNKIPSNIQHHKSSRGQLCLEVPPRELIICKDGITLTYFIEEILKPHFAIQFIKVNSKEKSYIYDEYDHYAKGYWKYFKEYFNLPTNQLVLKALANTVYNLSWSKSKPCFCGSRELYNKCHLSLVEGDMSMTENEVRKIYFMLKKDYET